MSDTHKKCRRILVLEDDVLDRQLIGRLLRQSSLSGCEVRNVGTLKEALSALQADDFDVVLLDMNVPDSAGMSTLMEVSRACGDAAIIVVTGDDNGELGASAISQGAEDYLVKDKFDAHSLAKSIAHAVEHKEIKCKLWSQNEFLVNILESLTYPFYVVDVRNYSVVVANSAAMKGHPNSHTSCYQLSGNRDRPCEGPDCPCPMKEVMRTGRPVMVEHIHRDSSLGDRYFEFYAYPLFDENQSVSRIIEYCHDVTSRKQAEKEKDLAEAHLWYAQKMEAVGTLAGGIAHDFNNMLGALIGYVNLAMADIPHASLAHCNLQEALTAANRAKDLVQQILTFGRENEEWLKPIQIAPIIREATKTIAASLPKNITVSTDIAETSSMVMANVAQIHQILLNLCTNAAHAMEKEGGTLYVIVQDVDIPARVTMGTAVLDAGSYVQLSVTDTGCGMSEEVRSRIFEPFFTTKEVGKGTGMGLAVVHGIAKKHKATVTVSSREGVGSSFSLFLPRMEVTATDPAGSADKQPTDDRQMILIVDDEPLMVDVTRQILERLGYVVVGRIKSEEALQVFQDDPDRFDLVITDYRMPGMNGTQLARELIDIRPDVPILLCTGFSDQIGPEETRRFGIRAYVAKPVTIKDLDAIIRDILDKQKVGV